MMKDSLSHRSRSNREGPLRLGRFIRACEMQRKYIDLPRVKLSEEIRKHDSVSILVDSEFFLAQTLWDTNDRFSAERDFLRFVAQFEGAKVTFTIGSKGDGGDPLSSCDEAEPGALPSRKTPPGVDIEAGKIQRPQNSNSRQQSIGAYHDGTSKHFFEQEGGAIAGELSHEFPIGKAKGASEGVSPHLERPAPQLVGKLKSSENKVAFSTNTSGPGAPQRIIMSPPRPLDAFELKSQTDELNSGARDKSRACKPLTLPPEGSKCILLDPQIVKSPAKDVQPGSQGFDLAGEDPELGSSFEPKQLLPTARSLFVEMAEKHSYGIIQIDEDPGDVGETAAYTRRVAVAAQAFTYAVVGGADFLCFNFRDTYDIRFTDINPYRLAFVETTPFRAQAIAETMKLGFNGLILFTCVIGNRFCHQSRRIFYHLSSGRGHQGSLPLDEHEQASKALEEIRKFEKNDYHTLFEYVSFGVGFTGHSQSSIEASFAYYSLMSSQENMDWNHLAANKSEATKIMDISNWRRGSLSKGPQNTQAKWTPASRYPPLSPPRFPTRAKVPGFISKWTGEPPSL